MRTLIDGGAACAGINELDIPNAPLCDIPLQFQILWVEVELRVYDEFRFRFLGKPRNLLQSSLSTAIGFSMIAAGTPASEACFISG